MIKLLKSILNPTIGVNIGSGKNWSAKGWVGLDCLEGQMLDSNTKFPFKNNSLKYSFSEHFFEHVSDAVVKNLFEEVGRCLEPGGIFRIIIPDLPTMLEKYKENDLKYFTDTIGMKGRAEWPKFGVENNIENLLCHWFANYDSLDDVKAEDFYRGPPVIETSIIKDKAHTLDVLDFSSWIVGQIPKERFKAPHGHINCFTFSKLEKMLLDAGFSSVKRRDFSDTNGVESKIIFDNPKRKDFSMYVEAYKN